MREIKFRGYSHEHESWIYGDLLQYPDGEVYIMEHSDGESLSYRVEPKSVGQCTGLKDKNGKEIYEGDIVECEGEEYAVLFDRQLARFLFYLIDPHRKFEDLCGLALSFVARRNRRVIGNIHDNPIEGID